MKLLCTAKSNFRGEETWSCLPEEECHYFGDSVQEIRIYHPSIFLNIENINTYLHRTHKNLYFRVLYYPKTRSIGTKD
jgi:hypothetical protein